VSKDVRISRHASLILREFLFLNRPSAKQENRQCVLAFSIFRPITVSIFRELARAAEERGFESLFLPEHTHIPKSRRTPYPGGGELPKAYSHTHDPFVALSFAAAATKEILLGTGICLLPQRDPIVTAKCVASLDRLTNGRFIFGIGGGWNVDEMENHGARYGGSRH
jgi:alkanesulfonate monooxygenase SsuD/methylene tetrahydromethanopterin reductase-like flavin-dependent oxidoreductase (luciferase family)